MGPNDNFPGRPNVLPGGLPPRSVLISHASADQLWAEWIRQQLEPAGYAVELVTWAPAPEADLSELLRKGLTGNDLTIAVLSDAFFQASDWTAEQWDTAVNEAAPHLDRLMLALVAPSEIPEVSRPFVYIDLRDVDEAGARERLLAGLPDSDRVEERPSLIRKITAEALTRFPGNQPLVWGRHIPRPHGRFTGREEALASLRVQLRRQPLTRQPAVLHGMPAVGKTQLAFEYAHRFRADYDLVWCVRAENVATAKNDLAELIGPMQIRTEGLEADQVVSVVREALRRGQPFRRWLIIFDAATDPTKLWRWVPDGPGHVLITSRNPDWETVGELIEVGAFSRPESVDFLHRIANLSTMEAERVAQVLGDHPLALELAAGWLRHGRQQVPEFLHLYGKHYTKLFEDTQLPHYDRSVAAVWNLPLNRLREEQPAAEQLLRLGAYFAPISVPLRLFSPEDMIGSRPRPLVVLPEPLHSQIRNPLMRARILDAIGHYALARISHGTDESSGAAIQLHQMVQAAQRGRLTPAQAEEARNTVHELLAVADPGDPGDQRQWSRYAELAQHVDHSDAVERVDSPEIRRMVLNVLSFFAHRGENAPGIELGQRAMRRWEPRLGAEHADVVALSIHYSNLLRSAGRVAEARELGARFLDVARARFEEYPEHAIHAAMGYAADLRQLGDFRGARELDEQTLRQLTDAFDRDHHNTLLAGHNLAISLRLVGEFEEARKRDEKTLARRRKIHGENHPRTLFSANAVANDLRECGFYARAYTTQQRVFDNYRRVLGDRNLGTLRAFRGLAVSARKAGYYPRALSLSAEGVERHRTLLGPNNRETIAAITNFANDLRLSRDYTAAVHQARLAYENGKSQLGQQHPYTLVAGVNLAIILRALGDLKAARALNEKTHGLLGTVMGEEHPYTLAAATNLSSDLAAEGDQPGAVLLGERTLEQLRRARGRSHPHTLACASNLAIDLLDGGDRGRAKDLEADTVTRYRDSLGERHPEVIAAIGRQRADCDLEPPPM
ncbi:MULTISPECIES: FxSxx-COOH system tetratricopeptide repeat protein [Actinoalloteichus]|uniref:Tetratricopeptide repeat-containing protein n=3 Tax=Actinoalloteichus cyanogriseus TaxID=2893586 RepID=A0ABT1JPJ2_ACTCY|nr:FxSxx-COOH system tetratricopeptide repeat protein [Actinoalloteichus caeruleus]MCP2334174.1 Tetratricopeptide repeat-containing protein [Actinoalloteichus caeruleus DSM 43889]